MYGLDIRISDRITAWMKLQAATLIFKFTLSAALLSIVCIINLTALSFYPYLMLGNEITIYTTRDILKLYYTIHREKKQIKENIGK